MVFLSKGLFLMLLFSLASVQQADDNLKLERNVWGLLQKLTAIDENDPGKGNVTIVIDKQILAVLLKGLNGNESSMQFPFSKWKAENVKIAGSADGRFRIYAWDIRTGGGMAGMCSIVQYRDSHGVHAKVLFNAIADTTDEPGDWFTHIYSLKAGGGVYYIAVGRAQYSRDNVSAVVRAFRIDDRGLNDTVALFKDGQVNNKLEIYYSFFKNSVKAPVIRFDAASNKLFVRQVDADLLLNKYDVYHYDGVYFVRK